jgi:hypothetical protein
LTPEEDRSHSKSSKEKFSYDPGPEKAPVDPRLVLQMGGPSELSRIKDRG